MPKPLIKKILLGVLSLVLLYIFIDFLNNKVTPQRILEFIEPWGVLAPTIFFLFLCSTNIIPPFPVVPFWLVALTIFDKPKDILIIYLANITGNTLNFLVARYFGKPIVTRLVGKKAMEKINELANGITGFREFILIRIFGGGLTDYISYAAGFTNMASSKYIEATIAGLLPVTLIGIFMLNKALSFESAGTLAALILFYMINYLSALLIPAFIISKTRKSRNNHLDQP